MKSSIVLALTASLFAITPLHAHDAANDMAVVDAGFFDEQWELPDSGAPGKGRSARP